MAEDPNTALRRPSVTAQLGRKQSVRDAETANFGSDLKLKAPPFTYATPRQATDVWAAVLNIASFIAFFGLAFTILAQANSGLPYSGTDLVDVPANCQKSQSSSGTRALLGGAIDYSDPRTRHIIMHGDDGRRLSHTDFAAVAEYHHNQRLLKTLSANANMWTMLGKAPEVMAVCVVLVVVLGVGWLLALQRWAIEIVYATFAIKAAMWGYIGYLIQDGGGAGWVYWVICAGIAIWVYRNPEKLRLAATMISHASSGLRANASLFLSCLLVYTPFLLYTALLISALSKTPYLYDYVRDSQCRIINHEMPDWAPGACRYMVLHFLFAQQFMNQARLMVVSGTISTWWFTDTPDKPKWLAGYWLKHAATKSMGTLSIGAVIGAVCDWVRLQQNGRWWWASIVGIICKVLYCMLHTCIVALTRLNTVTHVFTGESFFKSGKRTFGLLKRNFVGAFVTEWVSEMVIDLGVFAFSAAITAIAWSWYETEVAGGTMLLNGGGGSKLIFYFLVLMYFVLNPALTVFIIGLFLGSATGISVTILRPLAAVFVGCVACLIFRYIGAIIRDATTAMLMSYAVDRDNGTSSHADASVKEVLDGLPCVYSQVALVPAMAVGGVPVVTGVPVAQPVAGFAPHDGL
jgi:hypothetical protein